MKGYYLVIGDVFAFCHCNGSVDECFSCCCDVGRVGGRRRAITKKALLKKKV
jgi:hypothetical protein